MRYLKEENFSAVSGGGFYEAIYGGIKAAGDIAGVVGGHIQNAVLEVYDKDWADGVWENREQIIASDSSGML